jgi:hypothetical protein
MMAQADKETWRNRISAVIAKLAVLTPEDFFDEQSLEYNQACEDIWALADAFQIDRVGWKKFWDANPRPRATWLPLNSAALDGMDAHEIYYRLKENIADERWVDGALADAFRSGSLVTALQRLQASLSSFELKVLD